MIPRTGRGTSHVDGYGFLLTFVAFPAWAVIAGDKLLHTNTHARAGAQQLSPERARELIEMAQPGGAPPHVHVFEVNERGLTTRLIVDPLGSTDSDAAIRDAGKRLGLTQRQLDILPLLERGLSSEQIADQLGLGEETIRTHRKAMLARTGMPSTAMLLRAVRRLTAG